MTLVRALRARMSVVNAHCASSYPPPFHSHTYLHTHLHTYHLHTRAPGVEPNKRGAGVRFGPDSCEAFLKGLGMSLMVRSHECVKTGYHWPYTGEHKGLLVTLFSASHYAGRASNKGAWMKLYPLKEARPSFVQYVEYS